MNNRRLETIENLALVVLPVVIALIALGIGRMFINPADVVVSVWDKIVNTGSLPVNLETVLWDIRFPRILLAACVGAGLSVSGTVFQSMFANPLATPDTLGVASGASFGAALALLLGAGIIGIEFMSLIFGVAAVLLTIIVSIGRRNNLNMTILAGIMIGSLFTALVSLVKFAADTESQLPSITYWLMGSMSSAGYGSLIWGAPVIIIAVLVIFALRWRLNVLPLSKEDAISSGVNLRALRAVAIICATAITAACVAMCGQVGWVGLIVPHICRMYFGNDHVRLIPAVISVGMVFMIVVDTIARSISAAEIPLSVLTAIIGAPFFIFLLRKSGGWNL